MSKLWWLFGSLAVQSTHHPVLFNLYRTQYVTGIIGIIGIVVSLVGIIVVEVKVLWCDVVSLATSRHSASALACNWGDILIERVVPRDFPSRGYGRGLRRTSAAYQLQVVHLNPYHSASRLKLNMGSHLWGT